MAEPGRAVPDDVAEIEERHRALIHRLSSFQQSLEFVIANLALSERGKIYSSDLGMVHVVLTRLEAAEQPPDPALTAAAGALEQLEPPLFRYLTSHSRAEKARCLADLLDRAGECRSMVVTVQSLLTPETGPEELTDSLHGAAHQSFLISTGALLDLRIARLDKVIGRQRVEAEQRGEDFARELERYRDDVNAQVTQRQKDLDRIVADAESRLSEFAQESVRYRKSADDMRAEAGSLAKEAKEVLVKSVAAGITEVAKGYQDASEQQRKAADKWRWIAFAALVLAVAPLGVASLTASRVTSTASLVTYLITSAGCLMIAAYSGWQSRDHRRDEKSLRQDQLDIVASIAWIADLPDEVRERMKQSLGQEYFGRLQRAEQRDRNDAKRQSRAEQMFREVSAWVDDKVGPPPEEKR